jgi:hypothetical protein
MVRLLRMSAYLSAAIEFICVICRVEKKMYIILNIRTRFEQERNFDMKPSSLKLCSYQLQAGFLLGLIFYPEEAGSIFHQNVS